MWRNVSKVYLVCTGASRCFVAEVYSDDITIFNALCMRPLAHVNELGRAGFFVNDANFVLQRRIAVSKKHFDPCLVRKHRIVKTTEGFVDTEKATEHCTGNVKATNYSMKKKRDTSVSTTITNFTDTSTN